MSKKNKEKVALQRIFLVDSKYFIIFVPGNSYFNNKNIMTYEHQTINSVCCEYDDGTRFGTDHHRKI